ncbi:putative serine/threonine-protein kinase nek2 [Cucumis melo var. makuwa]|uniref:Serine/threonine-protein kinase nek2 n=1 Tax=Cucumis melo var. makuwa TaxID=1194695 RepID=A0A5A7UBQ2_CUCMM|nr:putative serine/threonine-protein kinase nek2 [Cucumis melo var. makuwa]
MATQVRQDFYVEDPSDARWSIVLTPPQRDCEDQSNDNELGDIMLHCQGVPSDKPNIDGGNDLDENISTYDILLNMESTIVRDGEDKEVGGAEIHGLEKPKQQRKRGPKIMFDVTRVRSEGEKKLVEYNEDGVPIGENEAKLNSFIGSCVHYHIPIIYATWKDMPAELNRSKKSILKTAGTTFHQFKHWLRKRTKEKFNKRDERRISITIDFEEKKNIPSEESELDRASMWKKARVDKKGQYYNEDVQEVVNRIDEISKTCADKEPSPNDYLTQVLGTQESSGRGRGVGGFVTPTAYFHTAKCSKKRSE